MLVYDMFGGTIRKIKVGGGSTHYFNKLNDIYVDLTSERFELYNMRADYEHNQEVDREYCGKMQTLCKGKGNYNGILCNI